MEDQCVPTCCANPQCVQSGSRGCDDEVILDNVTGNVLMNVVSYVHVKEVPFVMSVPSRNYRISHVCTPDDLFITGKCQFSSELLWCSVAMNMVLNFKVITSKEGVDLGFGYSTN